MLSGADRPCGQRFHGIDILRAAAASSVLLYHLVNAELVHGNGVTVLGGFAHVGYWGVDMFFVISGFIMAETTQGKVRTPGAALDFIVRRGIRVIPLYWFCTFALAVLVAARPSLIDTSLQQPGLLASLLFLPQATPPLLAVGWTLNHEMFFYVVIALCMMLASRRTTPYVLGLWACAALMHTLRPSSSPSLGFMLSPMVVELVIGYCAHRMTPLLTNRTAAALLLAGFLGVICAYVVALDRPDHGHSPAARVLLFALPATLIVVGLSALERCGFISVSQKWRRLGDASYALYLTHLFVVTGGARVASALAISGTPARNALLLATAVALCWLVADVVHRRMEAPLTRSLLKRWTRTRPNGFAYPGERSS